MDKDVVKQLVYSMLQFLQSQLEAGASGSGLTEEGIESVEVAMQCIETAFGVTLAQSELASQKSLYQVFVEGTTGQPVQDDMTSTFAASNEGPPPSEADKAEAEELKNKGNQLMRDDNFSEALDCYTKAISKDSRNAVYYCNRAAAHSKLNQHENAIQDCKRALQIEPQYSKAYGRMGLAYTSLNDFYQAKACYLKALELEPDNESYKMNMAIAEEKLRSEPRQPAANPFAGLGGLAGLLGGASGGTGGPGGPGGPDLTGLLNNPALMNMATTLMSDPNMQSMMNNFMGGIASNAPAPNSSNSAPPNPNVGGLPPMGGGAGGGGIEALLNVGRQLAEQMQTQHPELVEQIRQQMNRGPNGSGTPPGGGSQDPSSQS